MNDFHGTRIIASPYLTEAGTPYEQRRSWRERLFSRPWRPLQATRTITPQIPMKGGYRLADATIVMHPETIASLRGYRFEVDADGTVRMYRADGSLAMTAQPNDATAATAGARTDNEAQR